MELTNCKECGKLFSPQAREKVCPVCRQDEEKKYQKVKDYLWDNPNASVEEVHKATEVETDLIIKFVKEGRLVADGLDVDILLDCERCGAPITGGRFCSSCLKELQEGLSGKKEVDKKEKKRRGKKSQEMHLKKRTRRDKNK